MKRCLLIFTATYPAGNKDGFVADELPYIAPRFDQVILLPVNAVGDFLPIKETLPEQCTYIIGNTRSAKAGRMRDLLYSFTSLFNTNSDFRHERKTAATTFKKRLFLDYFEGRTRQATQDIWQKLQNVLMDFDEITLYSYWLYSACRVMLNIEDLIKTYFPSVQTRTFSRAHRYDLYEWAEPRGYIPYRELFLNRVDGIFPCSADGVDHINHAYPDIIERTATVALGRLGTGEPVEMAQSLDHAAQEEIQNFKKADEAQDKPVFEMISCSWLRPVKRLDLLVAALANLNRDLPVTLRWTHFGDGDTQEQFDDLKALAASKLDFMDVRLMGSRSKAYILSYYLTLAPQIFINCSANEGVPVSIMEAMSCSLPVFATDVGGTKEVTGDGLVGVLWPKDVSAQRMADDILNFIDAPVAVRSEFAQMARTQWERMSQASVNYAQFADVLDGRVPPQDIPFVDY
ncbi:MAG: glycosyltransferase [Fastidiosipilaceae bacterium]|jgi:colanic acid/amylovoran biosynthesis glycosyltransferase|nr:glycosyltransferase [Clostridiaceae bacterium]